MSMSSKVIPGLSNNVNRGACDWGWQNFIAYGCQQYVVVADPATMQIIQVLDGHHHSVSVVKWIPQNCHHDFVNSHMLCVASGDCKGTTILWNVTRGETKFVFKEKNKGVKDLNWLSNRETGEIALLTLHTGGTLILWDCLTSTQLWKTSFTEQPTTIHIDPFNINKAALLADECIVLINDLQRKQEPSNQARKMSFSNTVQGLGIAANTTSLQIKRNSTSSLNKFLNITSTLMGETKPRRKSSSESEKPAEKCVHVAYHPRLRHVLLMVYPSCVQMLDLDVNMVIATIKLERQASPFVKVVPCLQTDLLYCLHENGCISLRLRRDDTSRCSYVNEPATPSPESPVSPNSFGSTPSPSYDVRNIAYDVYWQSDVMRLTSHSTVFGFAVNPITETNTCLIFNDNKFITWELCPVQVPKTSRNQNTGAPSLKLRLSDMIDGLSRRGRRKEVTSSAKFLLTGLLKGVSSTISVIKTNETGYQRKDSSNLPPDKKLLAIGTDDGCVSLLDIGSGHVIREFSIHSDAVRGIEWVENDALLSWAFLQSNSSASKGKNELLLLRTMSGKSEIYRQSKPAETAITAVKLSPLGNYLVIAFRHSPLEIWDFHRRTLSREIPTTFILPNKIIWSPITSSRKIKQRVDKNRQQIQTENRGIWTNEDMQKNEKKIETEQCIIVDHHGNLCRLTLEDRRVSDILITQIEGSLNSAVSLSMRANFLLVGDSSGSLFIVDINKQTKNIPKQIEKSFSGLKKVILNSAAADTRFVLLHDGGIDLCMYKQDKLKIVGHLKNAKEGRKAINVEWVNATHIAIATQDGALLILDSMDASQTYPMAKRELADPIFCPHSLTVTGSLLMKHVLQHLQTADDTSNTVQLNHQHKELEDSISRQIHLIDKNVLEYLHNSENGTGERCLTAASLFGDEFDLRFWTLALHCLKNVTNKKDEKNRGSVVGSGNDFLTTAAAETLSDPGFIYRDHTCSESWCDVLMDQDCFWNQQLHRARLHDKWRTNSKHRYTCVDNYILLNRLQDAVKLLLETDFESDGYREDYLRASLLSCDRNNTTAQSTMKLVATHLIINGKIEEGVSVLCLMDKVLDACRYLQSYNEWEKAAWIAKAVLSEEECAEIFTKWTEHLIQSKQMILAVFVMLSQRRFLDVAKTLSSIGFVDIAACFLEACKEHRIDIEDPITRDIMSSYGKHLDSLGNTNGAQRKHDSCRYMKTPKYVIHEAQKVLDEYRKTKNPDKSGVGYGVMEEKASRTKRLMETFFKNGVMHRVTRIYTMSTT